MCLTDRQTDRHTERQTDRQRSFFDRSRRRRDALGQPVSSQKQFVRRLKIIVATDLTTSPSKPRWLLAFFRGMICLQCQGHGTSRTNTEMIFCNGICQMERPEYHFVQAQLSEWIAKNDRFLNASKTTFVIRIADRAFRCQLINGR